MKFPDPLIAGTLIRRYKRFLSDIEIAGGEVVTAHCANPGSMMGLNTPGTEVWLSPARNPKRKLRYSWELSRIDGYLVGINTSHPNTLVAEALEAGKIPELGGYSSVRREVPYGRNSRIDLLLETDTGPKCYVEIKNVTLKRGAMAEFPDSVTARGTKHLYELMDMVEQGARAVMLYVVQRGDCEGFTVAADIDPAYGDALDKALEKGVEALCYSCDVGLEAIEVDGPMPIAL